MSNPGATCLGVFVWLAAGMWLEDLPVLIWQLLQQPQFAAAGSDV